MASNRTIADEAMWDNHKDTLRRLYVSEEKTLKEVMTIMASTHGFEAT